MHAHSIVIYSVDGGVLFSGAYGSFKSAVEAAVKSGVSLRGARLRGLCLSRADFRGADFRDADFRNSSLSESDFGGADLRGADMDEAVIDGAIMPGRPGEAPPATRAEAIERVRDWFKEGHWVRGCWIKTPTSAYNGDCLACLHGGIAYLGGPFGPDLSRDFAAAGYTVDWNDEKGRTMEDVVAACEAMLAKEKAA